jgi:hypothetical protein
MPKKPYKEFCWRCQVLPDSEDAILLSYLQNHPFFSFKETILPLIKARWLLAALRKSGTHSSTDLEYLRRESINFLLRQIDEVCRDAGFSCNELGWTDYRLTDYPSFERWWSLVFSAYFLLTSPWAKTGILNCCYSSG